MPYAIKWSLLLDCLALICWMKSNTCFLLICAADLFFYVTIYNAFCSIYAFDERSWGEEVLFSPLIIRIYMIPVFIWTMITTIWSILSHLHMHEWFWRHYVMSNPDFDSVELCIFALKLLKFDSFCYFDECIKADAYKLHKTSTFYWYFGNQMS